MEIENIEMKDCVVRRTGKVIDYDKIHEGDIIMNIHTDKIDIRGDIRVVAICVDVIIIRVPGCDKITISANDNPRAYSGDHRISLYKTLDHPDWNPEFNSGQFYHLYDTETNSESLIYVVNIRRDDIKCITFDDNMIKNIDKSVRSFMGYPQSIDDFKHKKFIKINPTKETKTDDDDNDEISKSEPIFDTINTDDNDTLIAVDNRLRDPGDYHSTRSVISRLLSFYSYGAIIKENIMDVKIPETRHSKNIPDVISDIDPIKFHLIQLDESKKHVKKCVYVEARYLHSIVEDHFRILRFNVLETKTDSSVDEFCEGCVQTYIKAFEDFNKHHKED